MQASVQNAFGSPLQRLYTLLDHELPLDKQGHPEICFDLQFVCICFMTLANEESPHSKNENFHSDLATKPSADQRAYHHGTLNPSKNLLVVVPSKNSSVVGVNTKISEHQDESLSELY